MNDFYVYVLLDNRKPGKFIYGEYVFEYEPFYIGKGSGYRKNVHFSNSKLNNGGNIFKCNIIKKIIKETKVNPITMIISNNIGEMDAHTIEIKLIKLIGRRDLNFGPLTNLTDGGEGHTGCLKYIGEKSSFYGKTHKKESYSNISKPVNQMTLSGELIKTFNSIREAAKETNSIPTNISIAARGIRKNHNGYKWEFVDKSDIKPNVKKTERIKFDYIEKIDPHTNKVIDKYETVTLAAKSINVDTTRIVACLRGRKNTCGGYKWKYKTL